MSEDTQEIDLKALKETRAMKRVSAEQATEKQATEKQATEKMSEDELADLLAEPEVHVTDHTREINLRALQQKKGEA